MLAMQVLSLLILLIIIKTLSLSYHQAILKYSNIWILEDLARALRMKFRSYGQNHAVLKFLCVVNTSPFTQRCLKTAFDISLLTQIWLCVLDLFEIKGIVFNSAILTSVHDEKWIEERNSLKFDNISLVINHRGFMKQISELRSTLFHCLVGVYQFIACIWRNPLEVKILHHLQASNL